MKSKIKDQIKAFELGKKEQSLKKNPYLPGSKESRRWKDGFYDVNIGKIIK